MPKPLRGLVHDLFTCLWICHIGQECQHPLRPILLREVIEFGLFTCSCNGNFRPFLYVCLCNRASYPSSRSGHDCNFSIKLSHFGCSFFVSPIQMISTFEPASPHGTSLEK